MKPETIIQTAARCFGCTPEGIRSKNHKDRLHSDARRAVYVILRKHAQPRWKYREIAREFKRASAGSIHAMSHRGIGYAETDPEYAARYHKLLSMLNGKEPAQ